MFLRPFLRVSRSVSPRFATTFIVKRTLSTPPFPTVPQCPSPTCACAATPELPAGLPIEHNKPLNGTMAAYAEQVLVCTGKDDWLSRIEDENSGDNLAADIKELMGRGGTYSDPYHNVSTLNSSFPSTAPPPNRSEVQTNSVYLLPSFKYVPFLPRVSFDSVQALVRGYLLPTSLNRAHDALSPIHRDRLLRSTEIQSLLFGVQDVKDILVLICGHGGRDARCGIFGPVLRTEFEHVLTRNNFNVLKGPVAVENNKAEMIEGPSSTKTTGTARVGLISHIGGHKFAGNVIVYIPPGSRLTTGEAHPLAGCGIWYGLIEPKHVDGIVQETVLQGRVIAEKFRGGIKTGGEILRL
ncbi:hypothetical protein BP5796_00079 [Coleophoma crateriformis]|uniref:Altered inheritance of mitochondria protein 32 n=1 Tax=Coleophoma crateriformis TaxID=565419 RepID=A0A3D8T6Z1_9HELO|nr:hypothetical protein BP5796_00079 [Coleophoma crateriformis]